MTGVQTCALPIYALHHYGHWTTLCPSLNEFDPNPYFGIAPAVASKLGIIDGQMVRIARGAFSLTAPLKISETIEAPIIYAPHNFSSAMINNLTSRSERVVYVTLEKA